MASKQQRVIVGVDFDTTFSGYAFLLINSANKEAANGLLVEEQFFTHSHTLTHSPLKHVTHSLRDVRVAFIVISKDQLPEGAADRAVQERGDC